MRLTMYGVPAPHLIGGAAKQEVSNDSKGKEEMRCLLHLKVKGQRSMHLDVVRLHLVEYIEHLPLDNCLHTLRVQGLTPTGNALQYIQDPG